MSLEDKIEEYKELRNLCIGVGLTGIGCVVLGCSVPNLPKYVKYELAAPILELPIAYYIHRRYIKGSETKPYV
jgi:hypothetical protein